MSNSDFISISDSGTGISTGMSGIITDSSGNEELSIVSKELKSSTLISIFLFLKLLNTNLSYAPPSYSEE